MYSSKKHIATILVDFALLTVALLLHFNPLFSLKIYGANPMLPLAVLTAVSMFSSEIYAVMAGFLTGIFTDSVSSTAFGFNTLVFMLIGLAVSFTVHYLFNNNVRSACALALLNCLFYFILRWLFFNTIGHLPSDSFTYLYKVAMPSVLYTAAVSLLIYLLRKRINKKSGI